MTELENVTIAILLCQDNEEHLGLLLHPSFHDLQDPSRKTDRVGYAFNEASARLVYLGNDYYNLRVNGGRTLPQPEWRDIYIADGPPALEKNERLSLCYPLNCLRPAPPFRIPHWLIGRLTALGMEVRQPMMHSRPTPLRLGLHLEARRTGRSWRASFMCTLSIMSRVRQDTENSRYGG